MFRTLSIAVVILCCSITVSVADILPVSPDTQEFQARPGVQKTPDDPKNPAVDSDKADSDQPEADQASTDATIKEKAVEKRRTQLTRQALSCRGSRYVWGGNGRGGVFDCSGFTQFLYAKKGIKLPHSAKEQYCGGTPVEKSDLKEGDLVFFNTRGPLTHVGMYIGDGQFIHAANPRRGVVTDRLDEPYYVRHYAGARRYPVPKDANQG